MAQRSQWFLLLLVLLFIYAASSDGIPLSSLKTFDPATGKRELNNFVSGSFKLSHDVEAHSLKDIQEIFVVGDEGQRISGRRMDLETMDYPGTGANGGHIPKRP